MRERRAGRLNRASPGPVLEAIQQAADERATTLWSVAIAYVACSGSTWRRFATTMPRSASPFLPDQPSWRCRETFRGSRRTQERPGPCGSGRLFRRRRRPEPGSAPCMTGDRSGLAAPCGEVGRCRHLACDGQPVGDVDSKYSGELAVEVDEVAAGFEGVEVDVVTGVNRRVEQEAGRKTEQVVGGQRDGKQVRFLVPDPLDRQLSTVDRDLRRGGLVLDEGHLRPHERLGALLGWVVDEGEVAIVYHGEDDLLPGRNGAGPLDWFGGESAGQEPRVARLSLAAELAGGIGQWFRRGGLGERPSPVASAGIGEGGRLGLRGRGPHGGGDAEGYPEQQAQDSTAGR